MAERWGCDDDVARDLARLDDFGADYQNYTAEVLTNKGRGSRKREKSAPGHHWIDPRTGEKVELKFSEEEEEDEYSKYASDDIKAELRSVRKSGYTTGIGRGRPLENSRLKDQLRTVNSHMMCNDVIEEYVNREAEKRSPKKSFSPISAPSSKKRSNQRYSSDSSMNSAFEPDRLQKTSPKRPAPSKETELKKIEIVNSPPSFKTSVKKRTNRNALISSLLHQMEEEQKSEITKVKGFAVKRTEENDSGSNILSEVMTDDDVVIGSEVGNAEHDFELDFRAKEPSIIDSLSISPKPFSDLVRESENDISEFKSEFLKSFVQAEGNISITKDVLPDLEKKKSPKKWTMVFTNSKRGVNNNNNNISKEKVYEKLAEKVRKEKCREKIDGGIYDVTPNPFFGKNANKPESSAFIPKPRFSDKKKEKENGFSLINADFPSLS